MRTGRPPKDPRERILAKVSIDENGCWIWTGASGPPGYGMIAMPQGGGRRTATRLVHRVSYEVFIGPIPEGLTIDHVYARGCRSRLCVNPAHLEAVTLAENSRRRPNIQSGLCPKGHPYDATDKFGSRLCRRCIRASTSRWRQRNKAHRAAYAREYRRRQKLAPTQPSLFEGPA